MQYINDAVAASGFLITEVVSGMAPGIDSLGWEWADNVGIPTTKMPADWRPHGRQDRFAGYYRNVAMGEYAAAGPKGGACIIIHDGISGGSQHMLQVARKLKLKTFVYTPEGFTPAIQP
jgi:hypothetical protein